MLAQVTVDLDVLVRSRLLDWLREETETRQATIVYATHIFDGIDSWPTHLSHIQLGSTLPPSPLSWPLSPEDAETLLPEAVRARMDDPNRRGSKLLEVALHWLVDDRKKRVEKEIADLGREKRGAQEANISSEAFYRKCVSVPSLFPSLVLPSLVRAGGRTLSPPARRSRQRLALSFALARPHTLALRAGTTTRTERVLVRLEKAVSAARRRTRTAPRALLLFLPSSAVPCLSARSHAHRSYALNCL